MTVVIDLQRVLQTIEAKHMEALKEHGVTSRQVAVMRAISEAKGLPSQTDLVEATGIDRSTLADLVRRLLKRGLVARRRTKADGRAYEVTITSEGKSILKAALKSMQAVEKKGAGVPNFDGLAAAVHACLPSEAAVVAAE